MAILHDVTHFKSLQRVKDEFLSTVSHDLKNPISAISGYTDLLQRVGPLNDRQIQFTQRIQGAAENMDGLVRCLLQLTRQEIGTIFNKEVVNLAGPLTEVTDEFRPQADGKGQSLHLEMPDGQILVNADAFQFKQALRNLIGNAIKYTQAGGSIRLSVETKQDEALIHVKDTGCGIPPNELPRIFNRFHRVGNAALKDEEGDGLGLAIAKSIIEQHNGRISVESKLGEGSCFTLTLPLCTESHPFDVRLDQIETK